MHSLKYQPVKFRSRELAFAATRNCVKPCWTVMLGDDGRYWVVCLADAARLEALGFEYAD